MDEDASHSPIPPYIRQQVQVLTHDLVRARMNLQNGRLKPAHYRVLERELNTRIDRLESLVTGRLQADTDASSRPRRIGLVGRNETDRTGWRPPRTGAS